MVLDEVEREDKRRLTVEIRRALADIPFPKDIVVADPEEISRRGDIPGTVLHEVLREGMVLYERPGLHAYSGRRVPGSFEGRPVTREDFDDPLPDDLPEGFEGGKEEQG